MVANQTEWSSLKKKTVINFLMAEKYKSLEIY